MGKDGQRRGGDRQKRQKLLMSGMFEEMWLNRDVEYVSVSAGEQIVFTGEVSSVMDVELVPEKKPRGELLPSVMPLVDSVSKNNEEEALKKVSNLFEEGVPIAEIVDGIIAGIRISGRGKER